MLTALFASNNGISFSLIIVLQMSSLVMTTREIQGMCPMGSANVLVCLLAPLVCNQCVQLFFITIGLPLDKTARQFFSASMSVRHRLTSAGR